MNKAEIFEIKRFAVHDGDGIRTTVFFKGCPLKCVWCHNPEGIGFKPVLAYYKDKCTGCGECAIKCLHHAHIFKNGEHSLDRNKCITCGSCCDSCFSEALKLYGREMTSDEILSVVLEDKDFFDSSGGGVTLSGGECLMQADFCAELLCRLKESGINTAVDTCGFVTRESIDKVMPYTDAFLYDIKAIDSDVHQKCTGADNRLILDNLRHISSIGKPVEIRIPYVPGYNDGQIEKIADFLKSMNNITKVRVLPYHNYAGSKYASLDMTNTLPEIIPSEEEIRIAQEYFE